MGKSHIVVPSSNDEVALTDESSDQNTQIFYVLCETLFKLDQALVCSSACNTETMKTGTLQCYYLLQPSEKGPMLLRRLAESEEILPLPVVNRPCNSTVTKENKVPSQSKEKASPSISEEWEKLIIIDDTDDFSTPATFRAAAAKPQSSKLPSPLKPLDEKTSRILERLEAPKAKKQRASKPPNTSTSTTPASSLGASSTQIKKSLLPFHPSASQPLRPTFNRLRRKPVG